MSFSFQHASRCTNVIKFLIACRAYVQTFQRNLDEVDAKLNAMADLADELKQLRTKHEMTAKQNADMLIKLQVMQRCCQIAQ